MKAMNPAMNPEGYGTTRDSPAAAKGQACKTMNPSDFRLYPAGHSALPRLGLVLFQ
jgi:hypothetical protein